jgi:hypothetical protein
MPCQLAFVNLNEQSPDYYGSLIWSMYFGAHARDNVVATKYSVLLCSIQGLKKQVENLSRDLPRYITCKIPVLQLRVLTEGRVSWLPRSLDGK